MAESASSTSLLEHFRRWRGEFAIVVDEFDDLQGIVTLRDVLTAIVGEIPGELGGREPEMVRRGDGSWLVDGGIAIERLRAGLEIAMSFPGEEGRAYHTLAGLVMHQLQRVPKVADRFELGGWRFEVVDMDRTRVDKVLVARLAAPAD